MNFNGPTHFGTDHFNSTFNFTKALSDTNSYKKLPFYTKFFNYLDKFHILINKALWLANIFLIKIKSKYKKNVCHI